MGFLRVYAEEDVKASLYHVAPAGQATTIKQSGLRPNTSTSGWREIRAVMRELLHETAAEQGSSFPRRDKAVFFWTSFKAAQKYQTSRTGKNVIVEVDPSKLGTVWRTESEVIETLFQSVDRVYTSADPGEQRDAVLESDECRGLAREVVRYSSAWDGSGNARDEAWVAGSVPAEAITYIEDPTR